MKSQLKNLLIPLLASRPVSALAERLFGHGIPVFMLHRMVSDESSSHGHTPGYLRRSLQYLKDNGHSFVSLETLVAAIREDLTLPPKPVVFTIDDGFHDQASLAAPIFLEFNCPVTIFLVTGFLDEELWPWFSQVEYLVENSGTEAFELDITDSKFKYNISSSKSKYQAVKSILKTMKRLNDDLIPETIEQLSRATQVNVPSKPPEKYRPMTWDTARDLEQKGISFGPHTVSHPILSRVNNKKSEQEITDSWKRIKEELENPVPVFCYPNGISCDYGEREIEFIRKAGLIGAVSTIPKQIELNSHDDLYEYNLPRLGLPDSLQDLIQYSTWIEYAISRR